ncbi:hypothetical protein N7539_004384 [Penicillium diatomitis]|uniref:Uncharacterized protein n=1 Tax=Penicillium diatomitis TaxID=2819901 RepID=A0A9X0BYF4_9EURO|nr:uncharacterized protein N7539_004384 [Penicillium diatomitis]KAJ5489494.1 hypothetical protein N7539_004384 [Penicillium diatomitis]
MAQPGGHGVVGTWRCTAVQPTTKHTRSDQSLYPLASWQAQDISGHGRDSLDFSTRDKMLTGRAARDSSSPFSSSAMLP